MATDTDSRRNAQLRYSGENHREKGESILR